MSDTLHTPPLFTDAVDGWAVFTGEFSDKVLIGATTSRVCADEMVERIRSRGHALGYKHLPSAYDAYIEPVQIIVQGDDR
jgi:hypothetical protein